VKYNTDKIEEATAAFVYLTDLVGKHALVEVKKISPTRSLRQNAYLHLTFGIFGLETGYDIQEAKTIYKRVVNPNLYTYEKNGNKFLKSSKYLTTEEMTISIDRWRKYAGEQGIEIPTPIDKEALMAWENRIEQEGKLL
jgi:hypothetical protein